MSLLQNYSSSGSNSRYFPSVFPDNTNLHERGYLPALPSRPTQMPPPLWSLSYSSQQEWISFSSTDHMASLVAQTVKRLPTMRETQVRSLGWEDPLEKEMAIHSSTLAWKIPWTEEPGRLHIVHGVAKIQTQLSDLTFTFYKWYFIYASPTKIKHEKWAIIFPSHFNHKLHIPVGKIFESLLYPTAQYNTLFLAGTWYIIDVSHTQIYMTERADQF